MEHVIAETLQNGSVGRWFGIGLIAEHTAALETFADELYKQHMAAIAAGNLQIADRYRHEEGQSRQWGRAFADRIPRDDVQPRRRPQSHASNR